MRASQHHILASLLLALVTSCFDATAPQTTVRDGPESQRKLQPTIDWYECVSWDGGRNFECHYSGSSGGREDYWDGSDWNTSSNCTWVHTPYCDNSIGQGGGGAGGPSGGGTINEPPVSYGTQDDIAYSDSLPKCSSPRNPQETSYCKGSAPTGTRLSRIQNALDRMAAKGGICVQLAALGREIVDGVQVRVYSRNLIKGFNGAAPQNGAATGAKWFTVIDTLTDIYYDDQHETTIDVDPYAPRTLQQILAHELDHLLNYDHLVDETKTTNSQECSGLP